MKKERNKRSMLSMTIEEAVQVMKLGETNISPETDVQVRTRTNSEGDFLQFYYIFHDPEEGPKEIILMSVSDDPRGQISLCKGNEYFRTISKITKFLELRNFNLPDLKEKGPSLTRNERILYNRMSPNIEYTLDEICSTENEVRTLESLRSKICIDVISNKHGTYYKLTGCIAYA